MGQNEFTLDKAVTFEQWYMVNSLDDPEGFLVYVQPVNTNTSFHDVKSGAYFEKAVKWAVRYGVTNGTTTTTFSPGRTCSNAEILTFLYRAAGEPQPSISNPFTNIKASDYYYKAAVWAAEMGMVSGSTFPADTPCSRASAVTFIWQAMDCLEPSATVNFTDVDGTASYAAAVAWAVEADVTNGTSSTTFSPNDTCTRGQIATFLYRAMGW